MRGSTPPSSGVSWRELRPSNRLRNKPDSASSPPRRREQLLISRGEIARRRLKRLRQPQRRPSVWHLPRSLDLHGRPSRQRWRRSTPIGGATSPVPSNRGSLPVQRPKPPSPYRLRALAATFWCRLRCCEAALMVSNLGAMARAACCSGREHFDGCARAMGVTSTFASTVSRAPGRRATHVLAFAAPLGIVCSFASRLLPPTC